MCGNLLIQEISEFSRFFGGATTEEEKFGWRVTHSVIHLSKPMTETYQPSAEKKILTGNIEKSQISPRAA